MKVKIENNIVLKKMENNIVLNKINIKYSIRKNKRAKHLSLTIYPNSKLAVTIPKGLFRQINKNRIEKFLLEKEDWILKKIILLKRKQSKNLIKNTRENYLKYKEQARGLAQTKVDYYNQVYNFNCKRIAIRNQQTRWGSCSKQGNLNFNYRLIFLPTDLVDYLIVHEICHLSELNHGSNFWNLVAQTIPDYKERRKRLKQYSLF